MQRIQCRCPRDEADWHLHRAVAVRLQNRSGGVVPLASLESFEIRDGREGTFASLGYLAALRAVVVWASKALKCFRAAFRVRS